MTTGKAVDKCGFSVAEPAESLSRAVVLSVPHAGREYPAELLANLRVPADKLVRLEDRYADLLVRQAAAAGYTTIKAHRARAWLDLNRGPEDLDRTMLVEAKSGFAAALTRKLTGQMVSARARGGLGLIPRRLPDCGELWARPLPAEEAEARLSGYHAPYHATIETLLSARRAAFGAAVLLDVHSMPPLAPEWGVDGLGTAPPDIVIGDLFGMSAPDRLVAPVMELARAHGFSSALNSPYAGGYVLRRHGRPSKGVFAIQLEVSRAVYLDDALREPDPVGVDRVSALIAAMADLLDRLARQGKGQWAMAAE